MPVVCPTVLAINKADYERQMQRVGGLAPRMQIDLVDGDFSSAKTIALREAWWPKKVQADIHLMYRRPMDEILKLVRLQPHMVIVHAEAEGDFVAFSDAMRSSGVKAGVALLQETSPELIRKFVRHIDHVLIFSGNLGYFGGSADLSLLDKVRAIKEFAPDMEIGWDGGINADNIQKLVAGGVDVLNVGGGLQGADDPAAAYATLVSLAET